MTAFAFDAYVTAALFERSGRAAFALGDGTVRFETGETIEAHPDGSVQCAALHPSGEGVVTGGDDGRLVWSKADGAVELANARGRWIDAVAVAPETGLIAYAVGKEARVLDAKDASFARVFAHERSVADLAFDAKGRKLACATYGGAAVWFARIAEQKPQTLKWAGSHVGVVWSPDGKFLITAMQENALHGWRLSDAKDMRMGGYPAKIKSLSFLAKGMLLATSGANGAVVWQFAGANGPMGKEAAEIGHDESAMVTRVAGAPDKTVLAAGLDDGRLWVADLKTSKLERVKAEKGAAVTALSLSPKADRLAWGDEDGGAGVLAVAV
ncbi:WD40 repeat domain-containing protein [Caulobacter sp. 17J80-11]|uniref:WD40 repeat domain-containing protein n=1 Tax=Caulobacter sp. 17J80-11 TaxID=2763502 RepID=UPI001653D1BB|nr:WD40 repeat domain-containing protein [Caulobacter sp. 17J80-11]MBC6983636.1 WD40 repeat domain-containing protein [Caulobacter sp. 17J80-11]